MSTDPFHDIRGKRMSDLTDEQQDRAMELWLRENYLSFGHYYGDKPFSLFPSVFRVIDRLRKCHEPVVAWIGPEGQLMPDAIYQAWSSTNRDAANQYRPLTTI